MFDWTIEEWKALARTIGFIFLSFISFRILQFAVRWYLFGKCTFRTFNYFEFVRRRRRPVPPSQSLQAVPPNKKWRISNEVVSFFHSVVSGLWALYAILIYPKLLEDMITFSDPFPLYLVFLSFGYLAHDLIDLLINERSARILELLFHHVVVIAAFLTTLTTQYFLGVVVLGLLMEINSIFLHTRSLMNLYGMLKTSTAFKMVALLNLATFMIFRMAVCVYLVYWQLTSGWTLAWYYGLVTFLIIGSLAVTNSVLCYRVLAADGLLGKRRARRNTNAPDSKSETEEDVDEEADAHAFDDGTDEDGSDVEAKNRSQRTAEHTRQNGKIIRRDSANTATQTPNGHVDRVPLTNAVTIDECVENVDDTAVRHGTETATNSTTISANT